MKKWNMIIDVAKCNNCNLCTLASKDEHVNNDFPGYVAAMPSLGHRWIDIRYRERGSCPMMDVAYLPLMCQHCDDAPCMKAASNDAITKRDDGIVIIDPEKAKGQKDIVDACPYGAVYWNEEKQIPQHWIFDAHLLDIGWKKPRCEEVCVTGALKAVLTTDSEMSERRKAENLEILQPELATKPRVYYKNLYLYTHDFVGGTVITTKDEVTDCLENATVLIKKDHTIIGTTSTDNYGDFKFDGLENGRYQLEISAEGYKDYVVEVDLRESINLGRITLQ